MLQNVGHLGKEIVDRWSLRKVRGYVTRDRVLNVTARPELNIQLIALKAERGK